MQSSPFGTLWQTSLLWSSYVSVFHALRLQFNHQVYLAFHTISRVPYTLLTSTQQMFICWCIFSIYSILLLISSCINSHFIKSFLLWFLDKNILLKYFSKIQNHTSKTSFLYYGFFVKYNFSQSYFFLVMNWRRVWEAVFESGGCRSWTSLASFLPQDVYKISQLIK